MTNRIDSTNCTHDAALARIKELEGKLQAALAENAELRRQVECWVAWNEQGRPTVAAVLGTPK